MLSRCTYFLTSIYMPQSIILRSAKFNTNGNSIPMEILFYPNQMATCTNNTANCSFYFKIVLYNVHSFHVANIVTNKITQIIFWLDVLGYQLLAVINLFHAMNTQTIKFDLPSVPQFVKPCYLSDYQNYIISHYSFLLSKFDLQFVPQSVRPCYFQTPKWCHFTDSLLTFMRSFYIKLSQWCCIPL